MESDHGRSGISRGGHDTNQRNSRDKPKNVWKSIAWLTRTLDVPKLLHGGSLEF